MELGLPILVAHMVVFWYSQDANVTPPVALASFAGAGVAGASPMKTGFVSWKIAKGLYIIPIVMAYRPLLGNGPAGMVVLTIGLTALGLIAFTSSMEQFLLRKLKVAETLLVGVSALAMLWPIYWLSFLGALMFLLILGVQWLQNRKNLSPESVSA